MRAYSIHAVNPILQLFSDPERHWQHALNPLDSSPLAATDLIGYQLWLGAVARITGRDPLAIEVYAACLSILTPWLWYRFFRELLASNKSLALVGWALLTWLPAWIGVFSFFLTETLLLPLLGASLWFTWRCVRKGSFESFMWALGFWLAACLTKVSVLPDALFAMGYLLWKLPASARALRWSVVLLTVALVPLAYRTHRLLGIWSPFGTTAYNQAYMESGNKWVHFTMHSSGQGVWEITFGSPSFSETFGSFEPFSPWTSSRSGTFDFDVDLSQGYRDWRKAVAMARRPWTKRIRLQSENVVQMVFGQSWPESMRQFFFAAAAANSRWVWAPLFLAVASANIVYIFRRRRWELVQCLTMLGWLILMAAPVVPGEGRYRKPFEGLLIANALWLIYAAPSPIRSFPRKLNT